MKKEINESSNFVTDLHAGQNKVWNFLKSNLKISNKKSPYFALIIFILLLISKLVIQTDTGKSFVLGFSTQKELQIEPTDSSVININGNNNKVNLENIGNHEADNLNEEGISVVNNCFTDWIPFNENYFEGLKKSFVETNGVYSPAESDVQVDSVAWYKTPCKGSIVASTKFTSYSDKLINLNIYYSSWFRWEIGGRDLRSVRLYKNIDGCTAFQDAGVVDTENKFLLEHDEILPGSEILVRMHVFNTKDGKLRTELHLEYESAKSKQRITNNKSFFYEFEVGTKCDSEKVLNIDMDFQSFGMGLMQSSRQSDETPRVRFNSFKIEDSQP